MLRHIQKNRKLLIISDTGMYCKNSMYFAFGPVVKEVECFLKEFDTVTWIGYNKPNEEKNKSFIACNNKRLNYILLPQLGGGSFSNKLYTLSHYPIMALKILIILFRHDRIHSRAPSHPAFITMILSYFFKRKSFWFKYAGSWIDKASSFYEFQRRVLKKLGKNCKITVNGKWKNKKPNILAFENPCLNNEDRINGKQIVHKKTIGTKVNFCFVGALNKAKGVDLILKVLGDFPNKNRIGTFYFVGGGIDILDYKSMAKKIDVDIQFIGYQPKIKIIEIYKICHFIVLPSTAEGFPKVISEGMNFGCIPIVSDISAIGQYIKYKENGFLLEKVDAKNLKDNFLYALELSTSDHRKILDFNFKITSKFTYEYYINRMNNEIFQKNNSIEN